jgi:hypothetical protein
LPATYYFEGDEKPVFMCDEHSVLCTDQTGARAHPIDTRATREQGTES